jgi:hypothetical protein
VPISFTATGSLNAHRPIWGGVSTPVFQRLDKISQNAVQQVPLPVQVQLCKQVLAGSWRGICRASLALALALALALILILIVPALRLLLARVGIFSKVVTPRKQPASNNAFPPHYLPPSLPTYLPTYAHSIKLRPAERGRPYSLHLAAEGPTASSTQASAAFRQGSL